MRFQRKPHQFDCLLLWSEHFKSSSFFPTCKKTISFFWWISFCVEQSYVKWKSNKAPHHHVIINWRIEVKTGLIYNPVCIISCIVLTLLKISFKYLYSTCRIKEFKTRNMNACFINFMFMCKKQYPGSLQLLCDLNKTI